MPQQIIDLRDRSILANAEALRNLAENAVNIVGSGPNKDMLGTNVEVTVYGGNVYVTVNGFNVFCLEGAEAVTVTARSGA